MYVRCKPNFKALGIEIDGSEHPYLSAHSLYVVIELSAEYFRVFDDKGEPYLYPRALFTIEDNSVPPTWSVRDNDEESAGPATFARPGFFEDYFMSNGDIVAGHAARETVRRVLADLAKTAATEIERKLVNAILAGIC
jgi:hypothetical protein